MTTTTTSKEIRTDYLIKLLEGFGFERATQIDYNCERIVDCTTG